MGVFVLAEQPLLADMSVDLRCLKAGMSEQLLHNSYVGSSVEQMSGEGVAKGVGMGRRRRPVVEDAADVAWSELVAPQVQEHRVGRRVGPLEPAPALAEVPGEGFDRR